MSESLPGRRRQMSTRMTLLASAAIFLVPLILAVPWNHLIPHATVVELVNTSSQAIEDIHITNRHGGMQYVPSLGPGESETRWLKSVGEAGIRVSYLDWHGRMKAAEGKFYISSNEAGDIEIQIGEDAVEFTDNLHPS
jgi:hypothetical protein